MLSLLLIFFILPNFAEDFSYHDPKWLKLLHYKKDLFGNFVSEADSTGFFLDEDGKYDPRKEFLATIKAFEKDGPLNNDHPICKFPLRFKWMNQKLGNPWKRNLFLCESYVEFLKKVSAKRASIVFSSYYLTNPNSAFGHTLLRLSRFDDKNETEMLDYGVNYSAQARENNPIFYVFKGLFGGFKGNFASIPYYYKIREYSDFELRDLWSYDLKLSIPEIFEMVDHIWELGNTHFDYFYFHENCSYHLLSIIEVARPSLELTSKYSLYTIPADTIRLLHKEGLIDVGKKRESTYSRLTKLSRELINSELEVVKEISLNPESISKKINQLDQKRAAKVLDASIEAFDYLHSDKILKDDEKTNEKKHQILIARSQNPVVSESILYQNLKSDVFDSPAHGHSPTKLTLAENYFDGAGKSTRFEYRAALHDLLDPPRGSIKNAQLEIGRISIEIQERDYKNPKPVLDLFSIFNIKNYQEQNYWTSALSWEIDVGAKQIRRYECFNCPATFINGSIGNSIQLLNQKMLIALLLNSEVNIQSQFSSNYRVGLGPKFYTRFIFSDKWIGSMSSIYHLNTYDHHRPFEDNEWWNEFEFRFHFMSNVSLAFKIGAIKRESYWQNLTELGVQYFYD